MTSRPVISARLLIFYIVLISLLAACGQEKSSDLPSPTTASVTVSATLVSTEVAVEAVDATDRPVDVYVTEDELNTTPMATLVTNDEPVLSFDGTTEQLVDSSSIVSSQSQGQGDDETDQTHNLAQFVTPGVMTTNNRHPQIRLQFSAPMAAETVVSAISIEPPFAYSLQWEDAQTAILSSDMPLQPGVRYAIEISTQARTREWQQIDNSPKLQLQMKPLIDRFVATGNNGEQSIVIEFNYPLANDSVIDAMGIVPPTSGESSWDESGQILTFDPAKRLQADTQYTLFFTEQFLDSNGDVLTHEPRLTFNVPAAVGSGYDYYRTVDPVEPIAISFTRPVDRASVESAFSISPAIVGQLSWDDDTLLFTPDAGHFEQFQSYSTTINTTAIDDVGQPLLREPLQTHYYMSRYVDAGDFGDGPAIQMVTTTGRQAIHFRGYNLGRVSANFSLYEIESTELLPRFLAQSEDVAGLELVSSWTQQTIDAGHDYLDPQEVLLPENTAPGIYLLTLAGEYHNDSLYVIVSDQLLTAKRSHDELLLWPDSISGEPAGTYIYSAYDDNGELLEQQFSANQDPITLSTPQDQIRYVILQADDQFSLVGNSYDWRRTGNSSGVDKYLIHLSTERPIYLPGQTVYFKAIVRFDNDGIAENVNANFPATAIVYDSRHNEIRRFDLLTNDFGTVDGSFQIAQGGTLGEYQIVVRSGSDSQSLFFTVEEYRKPDFQVEITMSDSRIAVREQVTIQIDNSYFFGGPVADAGISVNVWEVSYGNYWYDKRRLLSGRTDAEGNFVATFSTSSTGMYAIEAVVNDGSNYAVTGSAFLTVFAESERISIDRGRYVHAPEEPFKVRAMVTDLYDEPIAGRSVQYSIYRYTRSYRYSDFQGNLSSATDDRGIATSNVTLTEPGWYRLSAVVTDSGGRTVSRDAYFLIWSSTWQGFLRQDNTLTISADQESYQPGDIATFIIESEDSGPARLTLERGGVYEVVEVELTAPITLIEIPITIEHTPNVYATIQQWDELDNSLTANTYQSIPDAMLRVANVNISVLPVDRLMTVDIITDREQYGAGDMAEVTLRVTNAQGIPVAAEIELAIVDEAIFSLAEEKVIPLFDAFYFDRPQSVVTMDSMVPQRGLWIPNFGGGGGGGDGCCAEGHRSDFRDIAGYYPALRTDANGEVTIQVALPDNLTTWRLTARAVTADTQIAEARSEILVTQDLLLQPLLPRLLTEGDEVYLSTLVHNRSAESVTLTANLSVLAEEILQVADAAEQSVEVPAGTQTIIGWSVSAEMAGISDIEMTLATADGTLVDAIKLPLEVQRLALHTVSAETGQLYDAIDSNVFIPASGLREAYVEVHLNRTIASTLIDGLEDLVGYPYGCVEQTMSRALPNASVYRALELLGTVPPQRLSNMLPYIDASVQRLYGFQHSDGGWGWWYEDPTHDYQTAWVIYGLAVTRQAGYPVDQGVLDWGSRWLENNLYEMDVRTRAFALYAMALADHGDLNETRILAQMPDQLDSFSVAALALALHEQNLTAEAEPLLEYLLDTAVAGDNYWRGDRSDGYYTRKTMSSDVRNTALILSAFAQIQPNHPKVDEIADWLLDQRKSFGWGTTNETSFSIVALTDYLVSRPGFDEPSAFEIWWDGEIVANGTIGPENPTAKVAIPSQLVTSGEHDLRLVQNGTGRIYYQVNTHLYESDVLVEPAGPVNVNREYQLQGSTVPLLQFVGGDLVRVELTVTNPADASYVIVEDKVPAGLEPLNPNLNSSSGEARTAESSHYDYLEIRDGRVSFFVTELSAGVYTYVYYARVVQQGSFTAMPAEMYAMYDLTIWGRSEGIVLELVGSE